MAANNDAFLRSLGDIYKRLPPNLAVSFDFKDCRIQCFPHVINTCVKHTLKALSSGVDAVTQADERDGEGDSDEGSDEDKGGDEDSDEDEGGDEGTNIDTGLEDWSHGDLLNKARGLIRKIRSSGQRSERFTNVIKGGNQYGWWKDAQGSAMTIEPKQLLRDVKTRWDSTYQMLTRLREFRQVSLLSSFTSGSLSVTCRN
jgi:hypothetical protein